MEIKEFKEKAFLSEKQFQEHLKLYKGYVKKAEEIREKFSQVNWEESNAVQSEVRSLILGETFSNNAIILHELYFGNLGESELNGKIKEMLFEKFKSIDEFKRRIIAFALSSRGWVVLAWDLTNKRLRLFGTDQHDIAVWNTIPLLALDVYEHAYFIDFGADKKGYLETFFENINWKVVNERLKGI